MVCLIKPQFEAGREKVGKKGVVRDKEVHREVICKVMDFADGIGFQIPDLSFSPIRGPEGNIEYLLYLKKDAGRTAKLSELTELEAKERLLALQDKGEGISTDAGMERLIENVVESAQRL
jgi:Predicted rRNA methylase